MENDINTLKLIDMASAHLKVQGIESGIVPMPGTDKSIVIGSPAEVVELMPELRGTIPAAWHNFARAIANLPHGAEANIAGMQSKAAQLLAAEGARARAARPVAASAAGLDGLATYDPDRDVPGMMESRTQFNDGDWYKVEDVRALLATQSAKQGSQEDGPTYMDDKQASDWAWAEVKREVGAGGWTCGEYGNYYGFFLWGWRYGKQFVKQGTTAGDPAPAASLQTMDDTTRDEASGASK